MADGRASAYRRLSSRDAVIAAGVRYDELGGDEVRRLYEYAPAREYSVRVGDGVYPSKAIVGIAFGLQFEDESPLRASEWSGGDATAAAKLRDLGFEVGHPAELAPPQPGAEFTNRADIAHEFGGQNVKGILRFPGESTVNVFSDEDGPYADDAPSMLVPFEYRGEGRRGHQKLTAGNAFLESARVERRPVRFWHRPSGGVFRFVAWALVLDRCRVWDLDDDRKWRTEFSWRLGVVPGEDAKSWPATVVEQLNAAPIPDVMPIGPPDPRSDRIASTYAEIVTALDPTAALPPARREAAPRTTFQRSRQVRAAVLLRAGGRCEYSKCTGMPPDVDRRQQPILEVDHIKDLARGGLDHPETMVALCPNCHAAKTRGEHRAVMRRELRRTAREAHARAMRVQP